MDPDEALRRLRAAIEAHRDAGRRSAWDARRHADQDPAAWSMAEHAEALDGWLSAGGYLPAAWARPTELPITEESR